MDFILHIVIVTIFVKLRKLTNDSVLGTRGSINAYTCIDLLCAPNLQARAVLGVAGFAES